MPALAQHDDDMDAMNLVVADLTAAADNLDVRTVPPLPPPPS